MNILNKSESMDFEKSEIALYTMIKNDFFKAIKNHEKEGLIHNSIKAGLPGVIYAISRYGFYE